MIKLILGFIIGFIVAVILEIIIESNSRKKKFTRNCLNCTHSVPCTGKDDKIYLYCSRAKNYDLSQYPVKEYNCCGHFQYTEELKAEQVREQAERYVK